jgi:hypothetical protein
MFSYPASAVYTIAGRKIFTPATIEGVIKGLHESNPSNWRMLLAPTALHLGEQPGFFLLEFLIGDNPLLAQRVQLRKQRRDVASRRPNPLA